MENIPSAGIKIAVGVVGVEVLIFDIQDQSQTADDGASWPMR